MGGAALSVTRLFRIQTVEIVGAQFDIGFERQKMSTNLLLFPSEKVREDLLRAYPALSDVHIQKKFPSTLVIRLTMRRAIARAYRGERMVSVDASGVVWESAAGGSMLPLIALPVAPIRDGEKMTDPVFLQAVTFIAAAGEAVEGGIITKEDSQSLRATIGQTDIYFPQNGPLTDKVTTLQTLFVGFRIKGALPKVIDLRFDKPIVTF